MGQVKKQLPKMSVKRAPSKKQLQKQRLRKQVETEWRRFQKFLTTGSISDFSKIVFRSMDLTSAFMSLTQNATEGSVSSIVRQCEGDVLWTPEHRNLFEIETGKSSLLLIWHRARALRSGRMRRMAWFATGEFATTAEASRRTQFAAIVEEIEEHPEKGTLFHVLLMRTVIPG